MKITISSVGKNNWQCYSVFKKEGEVVQFFKNIESRESEKYFSFSVNPPKRHPKYQIKIKRKIIRTFRVKWKADCFASYLNLGKVRPIAKLKIIYLKK